VTYGTYETQAEAATAQARWQLTGLLPADDPPVEVPAAVAVGGVRCDEWFARWQEAKRARSSIVRTGPKRGGAESTAARDQAQWRAWWSARIGGRLPHAPQADDLTSVIAEMEEAGRAPNYIRTHWVMITALFNWLVDEGVLAASPIAEMSLGVDPAEDRVRDIVVPDFRFVDMLSSRLEVEDRLVFELLLGTAGRRSEVTGIRIGDVDLPAKRVWIRAPVVEVEGRRGGGEAGAPAQAQG
jgi:integrase